jgi:hypothetical protein
MFRRHQSSSNLFWMGVPVKITLDCALERLAEAEKGDEEKGKDRGKARWKDLKAALYVFVVLVFRLWPSSQMIIDHETSARSEAYDCIFE